MTAQPRGHTVSSVFDEVTSHGVLSGYGPLLRNELARWWRTRLWWVQLLIWTVLLNGVTTVILVEGGAPSTVTTEAVQTFLLMSATAVPIGVVLTTQGAIVGEREHGTAAWLLSKPASRTSFVLAKLVAHSVGFLITGVIVPAVVFATEATLLLSGPMSYGNFLLGVAVVAVAVVFYVSLTVALGAMFRGRGPVAGIGVGLILFGQFFKGLLPLPVALATPWLLGDTASALALGLSIDWHPSVPIIVIACATVALIVGALRRFGREEF